MSVAAAVPLDVMDLSGVFCVADSGVLQDAILWNSVGMHTCSVWFSNRDSMTTVWDQPQEGSSLVLFCFEGLVMVVATGALPSWDPSQLGWERPGPIKLDQTAHVRPKDLSNRA